METPIKIEYENSEMDVADQNEGLEMDPEKKHDDWNTLKIKSEAWNSSDDVTETTFKEGVDTPVLKVDLLDIVKEEPFSDDLDGMTLELEVTNQDSTSDSKDNLPLHIISKQWKADCLKNNSKVSLKRSNVSEIKTSQIDLDGVTFIYQDSSLDSEDNLPLQKISKQWKADRSNVSEIKTSKILKPAQEIIQSKEEQLQQMLERSKSQNYQNSPFKCDLCYKGFMDTNTLKNHQKEHNEVLHLSKKRKPDNETEKEVKKSQAPLKITDNGEENKAQNEDSRQIPDFRIRSNTFKTPYIILNRVKIPIKTIIPIKETTTSNINSDINNSKTKANINEQVSAPNNIFICDVCKKEYLCKNFLKKHIKKWHTIGIEQNCKNTNLLKGKAVMKNNNVTENKLSKNKNQHKDSICSDETQYKCSFCKKCFNKSNHLAEHVKIHTGEKPYKCSYCKKCFTQSSDLAKHVRIHTGDKPYKCSYCKKCFNRSSVLAQHVRIHTGDKPYKCSYCTKCFNVSSHLARHVRIHTGDKPYNCSYCAKCFNVSSQLATHVRIHTGEKPYKCSYCTKCFTQSSNLATHVRIHTVDKPYKCSYCTKCFTQSSNLATHVRIHTGDKPYKCSYCKTCFTQSSDLAKHVRIHTGDKPYKCSYCKKCFNRSSVLAQHVRIHTGDKPYKCSYCTKCFNVSSHLARHVRIHTGEKPYNCSHCIKCFSDSGNLAKHVRSHTKEMDKIP